MSRFLDDDSGVLREPPAQRRAEAAGDPPPETADQTADQPTRAASTPSPSSPEVEDHAASIDDDPLPADDLVDDESQLDGDQALLDEVVSMDDLTEFDDDYPEYDDDEPLPPSTKRRASWLMNLLAIGISLAVLVGGGYFVVNKLMDGYLNFTSVVDYPGPGEVDVMVEIPSGATLTDMGNILFEADVVASAKAFVNAAQEVSGASSIQPGSYQLQTKMKAKDAVLALLTAESMVRNQVTIPEGLRNTLVVQRLAEKTGIPAEEFDAVLANPASLNLPTWANGQTEGFLFPETYAYDANPTAAEIISQMPSHFLQVTNSIDFVNRANALGISPYDAVTVASIIEKETRDPAYGPDIAQVLYNRLKMDMPLQLDSTVIYAVNSPGTATTSDEERANPSPYNTYMHKGLPPGAISNPGKNSLTSAVNPTTGTYLYFVAVDLDTGQTKFASTWAEHEANVAEFQAWCRAAGERCTGG